MTVRNLSLARGRRVLEALFVSVETPRARHQIKVIRRLILKRCRPRKLCKAV